MATLDTLCATAYAAVRDKLPAVWVRHNGTEYRGTAAQPLSLDTDAGRLGDRGRADSAVRVLDSELLQPGPAAPDDIDVSTDGRQTWQRRRIKRIRPERNGSRVIEYGDEYA
jgi:hypothetical protein